MRLGRIATSGAVRWAREQDGVWFAVEDPFSALRDGRDPSDLGETLEGELLAPSDPRLVIGIAQNGPAHASPVQAWLKSPRTVVPSGREVVLRRDAGTTVAEGEIAIVIGRDAAGLTAENAHEFVLGITAVNDLSSPDRGTVDPRNFESKSGVGYTPLGPWIDTEADIDTVELTLSVDGVEVARTSADALPVPIRECLAYVASWTPLGPGDVIMTGAPFSQTPITPGAFVEIRVGSAILRTPMS